MDRPKFTHGKGCNNRKLTDEDRLEIVRLYTTPLPDGTWMGAKLIGRRFGVRHLVVYRELDRAGIQRRSQVEAYSGGKRAKPITRVPVGDAPMCGCGCGDTTDWNQGKNRWNRYVSGHYTQRLEQNPSWQGGVSFDPYAPGWPEISRAIRARDGHRCQRCGNTRRLHVHHKDLDKLNNDPRNLITFCNSCHSTTHAEMRREVMP